MCCKEYPKLFCPGNNKRAIDYINDWIDSANTLLQEYGKDINSLVSDVEKLKSYTIEGDTVDLSKLATITDIFSFNEEGEITQVDILPGTLEGELSSVNKVAIINENGILKGGNNFTGNSDYYLSGKGTFEPLPTNISIDIVPITYSELLLLVESRALIPNTLYRITDYHTIILEKGTSSIKTRFDILVQAITEEDLNETVSFIQNDADDYFSECSLRAWTGKYCIFNDVTKFSFLNAYKPCIVINSTETYVRYESGDTTVDNVNYYAWKLLDCDVYTLKEDIEPYIATGDAIPFENLHYDESDTIIYTTIEEPTLESAHGVDFGFYEYPPNYSGSKNSSPVYDDNKLIQPTKVITAVYPVSMGVIYSLTDEYQNTAPYDFKSVIFKWEEDDVYGFTFSNIDSDIIADYSKISGKCYHNNIDGYYTSFEDILHNSYQRLSLNKILHGKECSNNTYGANLYDMYILGECRNNTFTGSSNHNVFTKEVSGNVISVEFNLNKFNIPVRNNYILNNFSKNTFLLPQYSRKFPTTLDFEFSNNLIASNFTENYFTMPRIVGNTIGRDFHKNTFYGTLATMTIGGTTYNNVLRMANSYNFISCNIANSFTLNTVNKCLKETTIGDNFNSNELGDLQSCTFEDNISKCYLLECSSVSIKGSNNSINIPSMKHSTIDYGCSYLKFSDFAWKDIHVHRGVTGTDSNPKVITYDSSIEVPEGTIIDFISENHQERVI